MTKTIYAALALLVLLATAHSQNTPLEIDGAVPEADLSVDKISNSYDIQSLTEFAKKTYCPAR